MDADTVRAIAAALRDAADAERRHTLRQVLIVLDQCDWDISAARYKIEALLKQAENS
jgi:hypothetical protein